MQKQNVNKQVIQMSPVEAFLENLTYRHVLMVQPTLFRQKLTKTSVPKRVIGKILLIKAQPLVGQPNVKLVIGAKEILRH